MPTANVTLTPGPNSVSAMFGYGDPDYWGPGATITYRFDGTMDAGERAFMRAAMAQWTAIANVNFAEAADGQVYIRFEALPDGVAGSASLGAGWGTRNLRISSDYDGLLVLDKVLEDFQTSTLFSTAIHELGHILGLSHPGPYNGADATPAEAKYFEDTAAYSVMSYWDPDSDETQPWTSVDFKFDVEGTTPMVLDMYFVQLQYGANMSARLGNDVYFFNAPANSPFRAENAGSIFSGLIWDMGGFDTLDLSRSLSDQNLNLNRPNIAGAVDQVSELGRWQTVLGGRNNLFLPYQVIIEKVVGGGGDDVIYARADVNSQLAGGFGNDRLFGGFRNDTLKGGGDNDILTGGAGADSLYGGVGNDLYHLENGNDAVADSGGIDTATTTISRSIAGLASVENLKLLGTGNATLVGNGLANVLTGNGAANVLAGGGGLDRLFGALGNDTYVLDHGNDKVSDSGGIDRITTTVSRSLASHVAIESLTLLGTAAINGTGNGLGNTITGNAAANVLSGGGGNDVLSGGFGNDVLAGGANNDSFVFKNTLSAANNKDTITDFANAAGNNDAFQLDNAVFTKLGAVGAMNGAFLRLGAAALDANDYIVYNKATGALVYDANGNVAGAAIQFATLVTKPTLTAGDFAVI
jgi:serralysin